jgi:hypothetical protein
MLSFFFEEKEKKIGMEKNGILLSYNSKFFKRMTNTVLSYYIKRTIWISFFLIIAYAAYWLWDYYQTESAWNARIARMARNCKVIPKFYPGREGKL